MAMSTTCSAMCCASSVSVPVGRLTVTVTLLWSMEGIISKPENAMMPMKTTIMARVASMALLR